MSNEKRKGGKSVVAKDDEYIMSRFADLLLSRGESFLTSYEMNSEQVATFAGHILSVKRNTDPNSFPDFVGELLDVEGFNVSSSKENGKGASYFKDKNALDKRMHEALKLSTNPEENINGKSYVETIEYKDHSYDYWISSLRRNICNHKESLLKYDLNGKECAFIARYTQKVLSYKDENGVEQWHRIGVDRRALSVISDELYGLVDYFVLFDDTNLEAELMPIKRISSYLDHHTFHYCFYPRENAGQICIGISEIM